MGTEHLIFGQRCRIDNVSEFVQGKGKFSNNYSRAKLTGSNISTTPTSITNSTIPVEDVLMERVADLWRNDNGLNDGTHYFPKFTYKLLDCLLDRKSTKLTLKTSPAVSCLADLF